MPATRGARSHAASGECSPPPHQRPQDLPRRLKSNDRPGRRVLRRRRPGRKPGQVLLLGAVALPRHRHPCHRAARRGRPRHLLTPTGHRPHGISPTTATGLITPPTRGFALPPSYAPLLMPIPGSDGLCRVLRRCWAGGRSSPGASCFCPPTRRCWWLLSVRTACGRFQALRLRAGALLRGAVGGCSWFGRPVVGAGVLLGWCWPSSSGALCCCRPVRCCRWSLLVRMGCGGRWGCAGAVGAFNL